MEKRIWNFIHHRHKTSKVILKCNQKTSVVCELEHDTLLRSGDETFDHNGKVVLVMDPQTRQLLGNKTIDLMTDDDGSHLILED